ncbi:MAG: hypothetical protein WAL59_25695 [Roseiarcus sp.]
MRKRFLLLLLVAAVPSIAAAEPSPTDVVTGLYRIYAGPKGDYQAGSIEDKRIAVLFTTSLRKALAAMNARSRKANEPILDFDPVTDSQDPQVERLSIAAESDSVVAATFFRGETRHVVRFVFKPEGDASKIDDISGGSAADAWDLRRIIAPGKK